MTTRTRRDPLAWALVALLGAALIGTSAVRLAGAGVSGPTTDVVYIATGASFPDALGAAATAAVGLGPVLLVQQNAVPQPTLDELNRLKPPRVVVVGGTAVVSAAVETQLGALAWGPTVTRIAGANRYETAANLSSDTFPTTGLYPRAATAQASNSVAVTGGTVLTTTIDAPGPGILVINGGTEFSPALAGFRECWVTHDTTYINGSRRGAAAGSFGCDSGGSIRVDAGAHVIGFTVSGSATVGHRSLTVVWVPFDGYGAVPAPIAVP